MAEEFDGKGVSFLFVYTREAHPSDEYPAHTSLEQKLSHARDMAADWNIKRPMLVDDVEGTVHRAYGTLPNMSYVLNVGGTILYRANWTDAHTIRMALEQLFFERAQRRSGTRTTPYYVEWLPQRVNDRGAFMDGLLKIGDRATREFIAAVENAEGEAASKPLREWWAGVRESRAGVRADD